MKYSTPADLTFLHDAWPSVEKSEAVKDKKRKHKFSSDHTMDRFLLNKHEVRNFFEKTLRCKSSLNCIS